MKKEANELKKQYKILENEIKSRLRQFSLLSDSDYFYELCFCLLTPQSNAKKCWQAVEKLKDCRCQEPPFKDRWHEFATLRVVLEHARNSTSGSNHSSKTSGIPTFKGNKIELCLRQNTRFYRNKAGYIKEAMKKWLEIKEKIMKIENILELRNWLAENVKGLGYKEASHFLRNIGRSKNKLAILDRHIMRNLKGYGVIKEIPKSLGKKMYLEAEKKMIAFSRKIGIPLDELDLLLWAKETGNVFK